MNLSHSLLFINISVYNMLCWNYFESLCLTKCLHRFLGLLFHKTLKDGFYIQKNFNRSYNVCVAIYSIWVLVHFYATHAQLMLPNSIRLVETPLWHLNLKQNLLREVPTVAVLPSFPISLSSRCIPWSWKILAMFFVDWYFVCKTFFWNFYSWNGNNLEPSSIHYFHHFPLFVFSSLFLSEE